MAEQKRARRNPNNVSNEGKEKTSKDIPGRPAGTLGKKAVKKDITNQEILYMTPKGVLCKKVYEVFRTHNGKHRRLLRVEKNVKG